MLRRYDRLLVTAGCSIAVAVAVMGLKYFAYHLTGSVALYSDALESIVNLITGVVALWAVWLSGKPADAEHPFGHSKAEYFSAVLGGVLIVVAALMILHEAYGAYLNPRKIEAPIEGMAVNGLATSLNFAWSAFLIIMGRRWRSPALVADGRHLFSDVATSIGVLIGLGAAQLTGYVVLDPALAALVALHILWSGWQVIRDSVDSLMDRAVDDRMESQIREIISNDATGALEVHDLRTRGAGRLVFIEFHLVVPATMTVADAHVICDRLEAALHESVRDSRVTIHVEPEGEARHRGVLVL